MPRDFTVHQHGIDSSGRAILATNYMWDWWEGVVADLGFRPVIVQGAFQSRVPGGGADASAGYHDLGGCFDFRTRDLSKHQIDTLVRVLREHGAAAWRRDAQHGGFDPHLHNLLGTDRPLASGAQWQWSEYIAGRDGLAGHGPDYEKRPDPLVLTPPEEDDMPYTPAELTDLIRAAVKAELAEAGETVRIKDGSSNKRLAAVLSETRKAVVKP